MTVRLASRLVVAILAAGTAPAQRSLAVHPIGAIVAKSTALLGTLGGVHVLSNGRVVADDAGGRRVLLFDSTLTTFLVLLDTSGATTRTYPSAGVPIAPGFPGPPSGALIPFVGDSTIFYDAVAAALVVIAPDGRVVRVIAAPFPPDAGYLAYGAAFDPASRALYRANISAAVRPSARGRPGLAVDSAPIVRATAGRVAPETLAYLRNAKRPPMEKFTTKEGASLMRPVIDPVAIVDEWTMLSDGTVAVVRGQDYHIDWIAPDGQRTSSPRLPFQWHRLSDSDKVAMVDSVKAYAEAHPLPYANVGNGQTVSGTMPAGVIAPDSVANYRAPFARGAMVAGADGNVWILTTPEVPLSSAPGPVYDVITRAGTLIDRVQLSPGFGIVGFSPGYVFMSIREGTATTLVKAKIR